MKSLKDIVSKNNGFVLGELNPHLELLCQSIQEWVIQEFAPEAQKWVVEDFASGVQNWVVKEFSPEIEKWVKEYMNNKQTVLNISDFCGDDSCDGEVLCRMEESENKEDKKLGTVEPEYNDQKHLITSTENIKDDAIAFIYGAIKKYGSYPAYYKELRKYIMRESIYIGKKNK